MDPFVASQPDYGNWVSKRLIYLLPLGGNVQSRVQPLLPAHLDWDGQGAAVRSWGITKVELLMASDAPFIPAALKLPFMVGTIGSLYGAK